MKPITPASAPSRVECDLHEQRPLRLVGAKGRRIQCLSGIAWITAYGQQTDVFLRPGAVYLVPNGGLVLAEAVGECRIRVELPRSLDYATYRPRLPARLVRLLQSIPIALLGKMTS